jgi:hypothetical protein
VNKHYFRSRVGTLTRSHLAVAGFAIALGLTSCNGDDSNPNLPPIIPVPNSLVVADVGNGVPNLLVATTADEGYSQNPGYADVILNTPGKLGTFQTGVHYSTTGTNPSSIAVADLTGSGGLDLVIAEFGSGSVSVFMHGATPGTFNAAVDVPTGGQPNQVVACDPHNASNPCDLIGNGKPALVLADMSASGNVIVLLGDGTGKFQAPMKLATGLTTTSVAVADLGDGAPSIVAATFDSNGNNGAVYVFHQDPHNRGSFLPPAVFPAGAQPQSVKIADVNGDGFPDIIVANLGPGTDGIGTAGVSVLLQQVTSPPAGTFDGFLAPVTYATPGQSIDVAVGDLNGDGKPDLVVANLNPLNTGSVSVLLQDPAHAGQFLAATNYPALGQPLSVAIADLNGDGHPDIAIADGPSAGVLFQDAASPGNFSAVMQVGF